MSYQALLFSGDEKTTRVIKQLLSDLEFSVETDGEPFSAVKRVVGQHFDALVVDCGNEQNAALLFKSARNSGSNNSSLLVAVVDGQAGIANAFRIGANFVLTKPLNLDQCKSTLRVARNLLRKGDTEKSAAASTGEKASAAASAIESKPARTPGAEIQSPLVAPLLDKQTVALVPSATASALPREQEPAAKSDPAAAFFASLSEDSAAQPASSPAGSTNAWAPSSVAVSGDGSKAQGAATARAKAKESSHSTVEVLEPKAPGASEPAKAEAEPKASLKKTLPGTTAATPPGALPRFASLGAKTEEPEGTHDPEQSRKNFFIAAVIVLALGAALYFAWERFRPNIHLPFFESQNPPTNPAAAAPVPPATPVLSTSSVGSESQPAAQAHAENSTQSIPASNLASAGTASAAQVETAASPKPAGPASQGNNPAASIPAETAKGADSTGNATSGSVNAKASRASAAAIKVSQDVSEALLVKKVTPAYPPQAKQLHLEGAVQLQANISKEGNVTAVKALHGDAALAKAASEAVRQWKYKPYLVNGEATEIQTQITVDFKQP